MITRLFQKTKDTKKIKENFHVFTYTEECIVDYHDSSPADILAMRIGQKILKDGKAKVSQREVGNNHVKYKVTILICEENKK